MKKKPAKKEELNPWQRVKISIVYDGHDIHIQDIEHSDNGVTVTKTEAEYLRDILNYLPLTP